MVANRNKLTLTVLMILGIIIIATIAIICYSNYKKVDPVATQAISQVIYPLFSATPFPVPDSLQYYYNTIESRGIALSGGDFLLRSSILCSALTKRKSRN
jgi:hypothetical protein